MKIARPIAFVLPALLQFLGVGRLHATDAPKRINAAWVPAKIYFKPNLNTGWTIASGPPLNLFHSGLDVGQILSPRLYPSDIPHFSQERTSGLPIAQPAFASNDATRFQEDPQNPTLSDSRPASEEQVLNGYRKFDGAGDRPSYATDRVAIDARRDAVGSSQTGFLSDFATSEYLNRYGIFISPNEHTPADSIPILNKAGPGVYITVGTDRGFIGAALTPKADHLLLIDTDGGVVRFNRINIALLKMAGDRGDYLRLRLKAPFKKWLRRSIGKNLEPELRALVQDRREWEWWRKRVRDAPNRIFSLLHMKPAIGGPFAFQGANYLYDDVLFGKLQRLARAGRIKALQMDLTDMRNLEKLIRSLKSSRLPLSVLDLSNAWSDSYIQPADSAKLLDKTQEIASPTESILLITGPTDWDLRHDPVVDIRTGKPMMRWSYKGFRFGSFAQPDQAMTLMQKLNAASRYAGTKALSNFDFPGLIRTE